MYHVQIEILAIMQFLGVLNIIVFYMRQYCGLTPRKTGGNPQSYVILKVLKCMRLSSDNHLP